MRKFIMNLENTKMKDVLKVDTSPKVDTSSIAETTPTIHEKKAKSFDVPKFSNFQIALIITFVIALVFVIICGRILNQINLSSAGNDKNIQSAKRWAGWSVGIFSTVAALSLLGFLYLFFMAKKK